MAELSGYFAVMSSNPQDLVRALRKSKVEALHATNGAYGAPQKLVLPTTLSAFQFLNDTQDDHAAFVVALNSDKSMRDSGIAMTEGENQYDRVRKIIPALATQFPKRRVFFTFYDEADPVRLYQALSEAGFDMRSLHKWGYGGAKPILGAEFFKDVYGFPFPKKTQDLKPAYWRVTPDGENAKDVTMADLTVVTGTHGKPYLSDGNEVLFPLAPALRAHLPASTPTAP